MFAWRLDEGSDFVQFLHAAKESQRRLLHQAKFGLLVRCLFSAFVSYADYFSDILLAVYYFTEGEMVYCGVTIAWPLIVLFVILCLPGQTVNRGILYLRRFRRETIDRYVPVCSGEKSDIKRLDPVVSMAIGRSFEMVFESIPQTGVQIVLILLQLSANVDVDSRLYVTVVTSLLAAGFIGATMDNDVDTNGRLRRIEPTLYGWLPESKSKRLAGDNAHMPFGMLYGHARPFVRDDCVDFTSCLRRGLQLNSLFSPLLEYTSIHTRFSRPFQGYCST